MATLTGESCLAGRHRSMPLGAHPRSTSPADRQAISRPSFSHPVRTSSISRILLMQPVPRQGSAPENPAGRAFSRNCLQKQGPQSRTFSATPPGQIHLHPPWPQHFIGDRGCMKKHVAASPLQGWSTAMAWASNTGKPMNELLESQTASRGAVELTRGPTCWAGKRDPQTGPIFQPTIWHQLPGSPE